ncbi:MAG TPA: hypothetical protein VEF04_20000 [Blastocatellia bacterium]|nr:hypothetical protein [Blastocatellia bacterium]
MAANDRLQDVELLRRHRKGIKATVERILSNPGSLTPDEKRVISQVLIDSSTELNRLNAAVQAHR